MKILHILCCLALLTASSAYGASCWDATPNIADCRAKANQNDVRAQFILANSFYTAKGVKFNSKMAVFWYKKAAENGSELGQLRLADMYLQGHGVVQNDATAAYWYKKADRQGNLEARYRLGTLYRDGRGVSQDIPTAYSYFSHAAYDGNRAAKEAKQALEKKLSAAQLKKAKAACLLCD